MNLWGKRHKRIPDDWRELYLRRRSPDEMRRDLVEAFDRIEAMRLKLWILGAVVTAEAGIIGWAATSLLNCLETAHKLAALLR